MFEMYKRKGWIGSIDLNKALESRFETSLLDSKVRRHNLKASSLLFNCCTITYCRDLLRYSSLLDTW